jgi:hypothetical protein
MLSSLAARRKMKTVVCCVLMAAAGAAWGVDWKSVPSPAEYKATVDLDSVKPQKNFASFTLRRAYRDGQTDPAGNEYFSTRLIVITDCATRTGVTAVTQYYGKTASSRIAMCRKRSRRRNSPRLSPGPTWRKQ